MGERENGRERERMYDLLSDMNGEKKGRKQRNNIDLVF